MAQWGTNGWSGFDWLDRPIEAVCNNAGAGIAARKQIERIGVAAGSYLNRAILKPPSEV
jgi:hypothetical protein